MPASPPNRPDQSVALRRRLIAIVAGVAGVVAAGFAAFHLATGHVSRAVASFTALALAVVLLVVLPLTRTERPAVILATSYAVVMTLLLLGSGWFPPGDFLWCFLVPPLIAYIGGVRLARWLLPAYVMAASAMVLVPGFPYAELWQEMELAPRFIGLLTLASAVSWAYEGTRARSEARLKAEVEERRTAEVRLAEANHQLVLAAERAERLARQAEAASQAKTRFLSQMSHDIRTPLTGIIGMSSLLATTTLDERQRNFLRTLRVSGDALAELIGDILDLARIEAGGLELKVTQVQLDPFLDEVQTVLFPGARAKGLHLVAERSPDLPDVVLGDRARLRQILLNMAGNAIKFTERGQVVITCAPPPDRSPHRWRIQVADTGVGIPPEQHRRIFESFVQLDSGPSPTRSGTGLGLAICARLADLMGGTMGLESELGVGSTFWVDLPLRVPDEAAAAEPARTTGPQEPGPLRLLVVDDSEIVRRVLVNTLGRAGHQVEEASGAEEAFRLLARTRFHAVLMDVQMPGMDGIRALRHIREGHAAVLQPDVTVIAVTALADPETRERCLAAGAADVLVKPVELGAIQAALARNVAAASVEGPTEGSQPGDQG